MHIYAMCNVCLSLSVSLFTIPSLSAHLVKALLTSPDLSLMPGKAVNSHRVMEAPPLGLSCGCALIVAYPDLSQEDPTASLTHLVPATPPGCRLSPAFLAPLKFTCPSCLKMADSIWRPFSTSLAHPSSLSPFWPGSHEATLSPIRADPQAAPWLRDQPSTVRHAR